MSSETVAAEPLAMHTDTFYCAVSSDTGRYGVSGDPVPYTLRGDNVFTILMLFCFIIYVVSLTKLTHLFSRQIKNFFYVSYNEDETTSETSVELRFQGILLLISCLLLAVCSYLYAIESIAQDYVLGSLAMIGLFSALALVYFLLKGILYSFINVVFFGGKKNEQFLKTILFLVVCEGVLVFPAVILLVYFDLPVQNVLYYLAFVLFLNKIMTFYKSWHIFFRQNGGFIQTFLYLCALEIIPLLALGVAWLMIVNGLKVNF